MTCKLGMLERRGVPADGDIDPGLDRHRQLASANVRLWDSIAFGFSDTAVLFSLRVVLFFARLRTKHPYNDDTPEIPTEE